MNKVPYPCKGGPGGACPSLCCYQAADALKSIVDLKLSGHPVDPKIFDFPYKVDEHGKCENVLEDGGCAVYLNRPLLCNIEKAAEAMGLDPIIFMPANAEQCNAFMDAHLIPKEKQIDVEKYRIELIDQWVKDNANVQNSKGGTSGGESRDANTEPNPYAKYPITPDEATPPSE
jgi:Fe-S-cluster containining protein